MIRLSAKEEGDLRWFFYEADGALGLRCALGGQIARFEAGLGSEGSTRNPCEMTERVHEAAERARRIGERLACMDGWGPHVRVLQRHVGPDSREHPVIRGALGRVASIAIGMLSKEQIEALERACRPVKDRAEAAQNRARVQAVRLNAEKALQRATVAYQDTATARRRSRRGAECA